MEVEASTMPFSALTPRRGPPGHILSRTHTTSPQVPSGGTAQTPPQGSNMPEWRGGPTSAHIQVLAAAPPCRFSCRRV